MRHRLLAGLIHLSLSAAIAGAVFLPIYFFWYPDVLFESAGGRDLFLLIVCVDVTLGPLITTVVYVPGKWGLKFDLAVIGTLQAIALAYGVYVLFEARPVNIVFVKDRFELVRANQVPEQLFEEARGSIYDHAPVTGPKLVSARMPRDREEATRIMMSSLSGLDLQFFPRHYVAYDADRAVALAKSQPVAKLAQFNPARGAEIGRLLEGLHRREEDVRFLPMRAGKTLDLTVLLDARSGDVLKIASLKPWAYD